MGLILEGAPCGLPDSCVRLLRHRYRDLVAAVPRASISGVLG